MRILVVEDEPAIADFVGRGLRAAGYAVTCVHDGAEGEAQALSGDYALVLLDILLPGRGGLEVLDAIRALDQALPVILLTAKGELDDKVTGLIAGRTTTSSSRSPSRSCLRASVPTYAGQNRGRRTCWRWGI